MDLGDSKLVAVRPAHGQKNEALSQASKSTNPSRNPGKTAERIGRVGTLSASRTGQMQDVIKGCKNHQHQDDRQTNPEAEFLRTLRQGPTSYRFDCVEQKVTAIKQWDWKEVQQANRDRKYRRQVDQWGKAGSSDLARYLSDSNRSAELVSCLTTRKHACDVRECTVHHEPSLLRTHNDGAQRRRLLSLDVSWRHGTANAKQPEPVHIAESILYLLELGHRPERYLCVTTLDLDRKRRASADTYNTLHIGKAFDLLAINCQHQVAGFEPGRLRSAPGLDSIHARACGLLADGHENAGENSDRQQKICNRARGDNSSPRTDWLKDEAVLFFRLTHRCGCHLIRYARSILVAKEFYIAAERNR